MKVPSSILPKRSTTRTSPGSRVSITQVFWPPLRPSAAPIACDDFLQVGTQRHHAYGDRAADEDAVGVQVDPVPLELEVVVVPPFDHAPGFVVGDMAHPLQDLVGDARPAIGEALVLVERGERGDAFRTVEDHALSSRLMTLR